ncbi:MULTISPECIES: NADP-dependent oxidoreductase [Burkholderiaceae]|jgi:NADPH:quinone reductase-like Zn-dependent oxidoreductase|uniref:Bifunctional protein: zinc-containing alcohol dehydrogenase, quinone oxidoreductase (NADPH:quinone reductase), Similar to arginate lyase n=1 Tax=Caballeronia sordidicola TaxID=196367 RepID=A0A242MH83_CABSO|nr:MULTISPECIES: NADP-dependent oxidoreductase [Burkholderiaceae]AMH43013.1 quinone oxidoreductase [Burkholderia sp. PAMC 26561]OTP70662.1 Bifunctional protein: zinc-containing alcohol dehydrogenase, quinone oxidoreductase (NADPH:quinone reductase), Similar to arginate lyase [Caballeronia sordidicola]
MDPLTSALPAAFKAVQIDSFGGIGSMQYRNVPLERPAAGQVLLRVAAAGVGPWDAWIRSGNSVLPQPLPLTLGSDIAGTVVTTGEGVSGLSAGDDVFGVTNPRFTGAYAEYALADAGMIARKPSTLSFEEAASVPVIAVTAWQMLFEQARLKKGDRVLVLGGAGNVGAFAVQLARRAGAFVIASASHRDADRVMSLGADQVFDTREQSFDEYRHSVDVVIDLIGGETLDRSFETVKPGGKVVSAVAEPNAERAAAAEVSANFMLVRVNTATLIALSELLETGALKTRVGEVLPLPEARVAHEMLEGRKHAPGKIVLVP